MIFISSFAYAQDVSFDISADSSRLDSLNQRREDIDRLVNSGTTIYNQKEELSKEDLVEFIQNDKGIQDSIKVLTNDVEGKLEEKKKKSLEKLAQKTKKQRDKIAQVQAKKDSVEQQVVSYEDKAKAAKKSYEKYNDHVADVKKGDYTYLQDELSDTIANKLKLSQADRDRLERAAKRQHILEHHKELQDSIFNMTKLQDSLASVLAMDDLMDTVKSYTDLIEDKHKFLDSLNNLEADDLLPVSQDHRSADAYKQEAKSQLVNAKDLLPLDSLRKNYEKVNGLRAKVKNEKDDIQRYVVDENGNWRSDFFFDGVLDYSFDEEKKLNFSPALGYALNDKHSIGAGLNSELSFKKETQFVHLSGIRGFHKYNLIDNKLYSHTEVNANVPQWSNENGETLSQVTDGVTYGIAVGAGYRIVFYGNTGLDIQLQYKILEISSNEVDEAAERDTPFKIRIGLKLN